MTSAPDYDALWHDVARVLQREPEKWPKTLLHYTSFPTLQKIVESGSIVLFNPLTMNDQQEMRAGVKTLISALDQDPQLQALFNLIDKTLPIFGAKFRKHFYQEIARDAYGAYIFCMSAPHDDHPTGLLSMWRAYGADGNGVCLAFNTAPILKKYQQIQLPVVLYPVRYESEATLVEKTREIITAVARIAPKIASLWSKRKKDVLSALYQILLIAAATHKHPGFDEEREWRVVNFASYADTTLSREIFPWGQGIRLGLRFNLAKYAADVGSTIDQLFNSVILGPSNLQGPASDAVLYLLIKAGISSAGSRIKVCTTPYRPNK